MLTFASRPAFIEVTALCDSANHLAKPSMAWRRCVACQGCKSLHCSVIRADRIQTSLLPGVNEYGACSGSNHQVCIPDLTVLSIATVTAVNFLYLVLAIVPCYIR